MECCGGGVWDVLCFVFVEIQYCYVFVRYGLLVGECGDVVGGQVQDLGYYLWWMVLFQVEYVVYFVEQWQVGVWMYVDWGLVEVVLYDLLVWGGQGGELFSCGCQQQVIVGMVVYCFGYLGVGCLLIVGVQWVGFYLVVGFVFGQGDVGQVVFVDVFVLGWVIVLIDVVSGDQCGFGVMVFEW